MYYASRPQCIDEMHDIEVNNPPGQPTRSNHRTPQPASSDPRLNRSRSSVSTSSLSHIQTSNPSSPITRTTSTPTSQIPQRQTQQPPTSVLKAQPEFAQKQNGFEMSDLVPKLLELVDSRISRMLQLQQKQSFEKEESYNRRDLERAKQANAFPATVESLQAESTANQSKLSKINYELTRQQEHSIELTKELGNMLHQMMQNMQKLGAPVKPATVDITGASGVVQNITTLEDDVRRIKRTILIKDENELPQRPIDLIKICNTIESQSKVHTSFRKSLNAFEEWKSATDNQIKPLVEAKTKSNHNQPTTSSQKPEGTDQSTFKALGIMDNRLTRVEQAISTHNRSIDEILTKQGEFERSSVVQKILQNDTAKQGQEHSLAIDEVNQKLNQLSQRPDSLGHGHQTSGDRAHALSAGLEERISQHDKDLVKMKENWEDLLRRVPYLSEASKEVEKHVKSYDGLATSLRSLELRYNNIHTEALVQQMGHAISEMYPSTHQLTEEVKSLKKAVYDHNQDSAESKAYMHGFLKEISQLDIWLRELGQALNKMAAEQHNERSALHREFETSISNLEIQFRDLVLRGEDLKKAVDDLLKQHTSKETPPSASLETFTGPHANAIYDTVKGMLDEMAALLQNGKQDMVNLLAEANFLTSQPKALQATESDGGTQGPMQRLEPGSTSELGPRTTASDLAQQTSPNHFNADLSRSLKSTVQEGDNQSTSSAFKTGAPHNSPAVDNSLSESSSKPTVAPNNKRPRETLSDNDSISSAAAATTTSSHSPAPSSNSDVRLSKKAKKLKRQSNLGNGRV